MNQQKCPVCSAVQVAVFRGLINETDDKLVEIKSTYRCQHCESSSVRLEPHGDLEIKVRCRECGKTSYEIDRQAAKQASEQRRRAEFERLRRVQQSKGFKDGWVSYQYRRTFGKWPPAQWRWNS